MTESAAPVGDSTAPAGPFSHLAIAEQGKVYALAGQHALALAYYREAIRLTVQSGEPEIVFRHYLECVLESLEKMGAYRDVLDYCEKAVGLLKAAPETAYTSLERAHVYQRQGAVQLKAGDRESAAASLRTAVESAASHCFSLALASTLLGWIERGLQIDPRRVLAEQERLGYFNVRQDTVDRSRAITLPNEHLILGITSVGKGKPWHAT
jgi:tetratricopeptide (TPR) repeat protein